MKLSKYFNTKFFYRIVALIFALFLFFYVNADQLTSGQSTGHTLTTSTNEKSIVIEMPLKVKGAKDTEFVAGLPDKVKVRIIGPSAIVTAINNTRNFEVYADLTGKGYGKHTITLSQSGLSKEVSAKIDPQTVKVKISKKATKTFPVQARYNSSNVASGYATGSVTMNNQTVRVTGAKNDVKNVKLVQGNAMELPFEDNCFDCAVISFGLRNVADYSKVISEMTRVIKKGGWIYCLEASYPDSKYIKPFFRLYFRHIMPRLAGLITGKQKEYEWLNESTELFLKKNELAELFKKCGLSDVTYKTYLMGSAALHKGQK